MRPLRNTGRRLATAGVLACGLLAVAAPAAFANHVSGVTATGCASITYSYAGFPNDPGNTIKETVLDSNGTTVNNTATGSFNGSSGTTTIPVIGGFNGEVVIPQATWSTNGANGSYNTTKPYTTITLSCPVTYTGDAYNLSVNLLNGAVTVPPFNQIGPISTMTSESPSSTVVLESFPSPISISGGQVTSGVTTGGDASTAYTAINGLSANPLGLLGTGGLSTGEITDTTTTSCNVSTGKDTSVGSTTIATLSLGGKVIVGAGGLLPANTTLTAPYVIPVAGLGTITLDDTTTTSDSQTVQAINISLLGGLVSVVVGNAESDVEGC